MQLGGNDLEIRGSSGKLEFYTGAADGLSSDERMCITSVGNVGIGSSSPINYAGYTTLTLDGTSGGVVELLTGGTKKGTIYSTSSLFYIQTRPSVDLVFVTSDIERMRLDSNGNLKLRHTGKFILTEGTTNAFSLSTNGANGNLTVRDEYNNSDRITVNHLGQVGIGKTSPNTTFEIYESTYPYIYLQNSTTGTGGNDGFSIVEYGLDAYINNREVGNMLFYNNGDERMRIDSSGRVLIGCSSTRNNAVTNAQFQIEGTSAPSGSMSVLRNGSGNPAYLIIGSSGGSSLGSLAATLGDQYLGQIVFSGSNGSTMRPGAYISAKNEQGVAWTTNDCPTRLEFNVTADNASSPTERMRIDSNGSLRTLMTGGSGRLHLATGQGAGSTILLNVVHSRSAMSSGGSASCRIYSDGDIENSNNSYDVLSDENLKENIVDANSQWDDIKSLRIRKFNFKEETGNSTHTQIGVVAQEVELVSPGLVKVRPALTEEGEEAGDTVKTVRSSVLYMKAVKALQEAMERIETLEQRLSDASIA